MKNMQMEIWAWVTHRNTLSCLNLRVLAFRLIVAAKDTTAYQRLGYNSCNSSGKHFSCDTQDFHYGMALSSVISKLKLHVLLPEHNWVGILRGCVSCTQFQQNSLKVVMSLNLGTLERIGLQNGRGCSDGNGPANGGRLLLGRGAVRGGILFGRHAGKLAGSQPTHASWQSL